MILGLLSYTGIIFLIASFLAVIYGTKGNNKCLYWLELFSKKLITSESSIKISIKLSNFLNISLFSPVIEVDFLLIWKSLLLKYIEVI